MYLKKTPTKSGRISLSAVKGFRVDGKVKQKTIKTFGFVDELQKHYSDPIAHFEEVVQQMNEEEAYIHAPVLLKIHPSQKVDMRTTNRKNIGCAVPLGFYNALGIERAIRSKTRGRAYEFDLNAIMRLLTINRIFAPASKLACWQKKNDYFFASNFSDDDIYRGLDILASCKGSIIANMNKAIDQADLRAPLDNVFYDVTNYYCETDAQDTLRRKGKSKEHRPEPIVQMGLLQDVNGLPITYKLFSGNTADCMTMLPVLSELKRDYKLGRIIAVADKGLNSSTNIALLVAHGDGFVFSQSIRGTKSTKSLRDWVISEVGYPSSSDNADFKIKSKYEKKAVHLRAEDTDSGKPKDDEIDVKVVAFFSRKYQLRARHEREAAIAKARELIRTPGAYSAATHFGAAKYVKGLKVDKETGEILTCADELVFDEERLAQEEACDGYYCIITSELDMTDEEIVDTYRGLWRIEESFKITKSHLAGRPMYVRTPDHIEAHFLVCFVSLVILRLMQLLTGAQHSPAKMIEELGKISATHLEAEWWVFDYRSEITEELFSLIGANSPLKNMRLNDIKKYLSKKRNPLLKTFG